MSHLLSKLSAISFLFFFLLVLVVRWLGINMPFNSDLGKFEVGCDYKSYGCLYGIVAGTTTLSDAQEKLLENGFKKQNDYNFFDLKTSCAVTLLSDSSGWQAVHYVVQSIQISNFSSCTSLRLGDLVSRYGFVQNINPIEKAFMDGSFKSIGLLTLNYGISVGSAIESESGKWFTPLSHVTFILANNVRIKGSPWYGFTTRAYSCQRLPSSVLCP